MIRVTQIVECEDLGLHCSGVLLDCDPQWLYHHFRCKYCEWRIMANCPRSLTLSVALFQGTYSFHLRWLVKRWGQSGRPGLSHGFDRFTCVGRWSDGELRYCIVWRIRLSKFVKAGAMMVSVAEFWLDGSLVLSFTLAGEAACWRTGGSCIVKASMTFLLAESRNPFGVVVTWTRSTMVSDRCSSTVGLMTVGFLSAVGALASVALLGLAGS